MRSIVAVLLSTLLVLTGHSMATVRGASAATGQMVICVGDATTVIYTDADGKPTSAPHICPDCLVSWHTKRASGSVEQQFALSSITWPHPVEWLPLCPWVHAGFQARGPPPLS